MTLYVSPGTLPSHVAQSDDITGSSQPSAVLAAVVVHTLDYILIAHRSLLGGSKDAWMDVEACENKVKQVVSYRLILSNENNNH